MTMMCEGRRGEKEGETEGGGRPERNRVRGHCTGSWLARGGLPGTVPAAAAGWGGAGSAGAHTGVPPAGWAGAAGTASPVGSAGRAGHVGWAGSPKKAGNSEIPDEHCPAVDTWHRERAPGFRPSSANWPGDAGGVSLSLSSRPARMPLDCKTSVSDTQRRGCPHLCERSLCPSPGCSAQT